MIAPRNSSGSLLREAMTSRTSGRRPMASTSSMMVMLRMNRSSGMA